MNNNENYNNGFTPTGNTPNNIPVTPPVENVFNNQNMEANYHPNIIPNNDSSFVATPNNSYTEQPINVENNVNPNNLNNQQSTDINLNEQMMNNIDINNTVNNQDNDMINNLNIDGTYNGIQAPDYVNEPIVRENIVGQKKNTITITKELKTVIIIALVLLVFIIIMPIFFDLLNNIRFH